MATDGKLSESHSADVPVPVDPSRDPGTESLTRYLAANIPGVDGRIDYYRFTGGHANLTYLVKTPDREFVLKREPPGVKAKSAHDMRREFRMLSSLAIQYPLAPKPVLLCEDTAVFGGVFCVMEHIDGEIVRQDEPSSGVTNDPGLMGRRFLALIDGLAKLHTVDLRAAGLADFGKPEGYRVRQVQGWCKRFRDASTEVTGSADDVISWLSDNTPTTPQQATVVHNDFKMDNVVWDKQVNDRLIGVLDWEMATVGDPLMDLACTLSFWIEEGDPQALRSLRAMPSDRPGVPTRQGALQRYATLTGTAVDDFNFYRCFGLFRRAAIEQQKFYRFATGQTKDPRFSNLDDAVRVLLESCRQSIPKRTIQ